MYKLILMVCIALISSCITLDSKSLNLEPGMKKQQVVKILGIPDRRSSRGSDEALQYQGVIGFGQCVYITAWLNRGSLISITERRGSSVAGCGLGSRKVDWGQMPKPSIDINITTNEKT
jgi:hypothetical protein